MEGVTFQDFIPLIGKMFLFASSVFFVAFVIRRIRRIL